MEKITLPSVLQKLKLQTTPLFVMRMLFLSKVLLTFFNGSAFFQHPFHFI